ncbi:MAG: Glycosyl transferase family 9 [Candidatus Gottesmanbacteria bacterium GW2011_GWC2_39_8]|uniref:Glycosyl transferase family 9 n=1 Tax=Candidatus Gottesmanbacteria bacterium GW2011_GWC2_39_8 TaxID=1618450 RepID=A0A0G0PNW8_9BACT|nr:MAG: Glycosyl transferase family 9 [Candidatus Gottesmanbacteria bacterium GW2011_GWC2_39_8]
MRKNILVINPFGIGDVLFSTVLVRQLRKNNPNSYIAYICNLKVKDILATNPDINEVFVFERDEYRSEWKKSKIRGIKKFLGFWREVKKKKFDVVFDLSLGKEYAFLCWWVGIKERKGFNYKKRGRFLTHKIEFDGFNDKPVAEYYLDLFYLNKIASLTPFARNDELICHCEEPQRGDEAISTVLVTTEHDKEYIDNFLNQSGIKDNDILIGIAPGGGMSFGLKNQDRRRWPVKKFAELADKVIEKFNARIILIWGPGEEKLVQEIAILMKQKPLITPATKIREMAELCKRCKLVICSEGGPLHIANSHDVKTISIFGPVDEKVYGPYPLGENNIVVTSDVDCRPCYKKFKLPECSNRKCLEDIFGCHLWKLPSQ